MFGVLLAAIMTIDGANVAMRSFGEKVDRATAFGAKVVALDVAGVVVPAAITDAPDFWRGSDGKTYRKKVTRFIKWVAGNPATGAKAVYIVFDGAPLYLKANTHAARRKTPEERAEIERLAREHDAAGRSAEGAAKWREIGYPIPAAVYDWLIAWCRARASKYGARARARVSARWVAGDRVWAQDAYAPHLQEREDHQLVLRELARPRLRVGLRVRLADECHVKERAHCGGRRKAKKMSMKLSAVLGSDVAPP
jgi:hypothetical protein